MEFYDICQVNFDQVQSIIESSPEGKHTLFLRKAHSLWTRFKNYGKCDPFALTIEGQIKSLIFATFNRDKTANLYEVVTVEGQSGHGYGDALWRAWIKIAVDRDCKRLKISCTPDSILWHNSHGLVFWGIDRSGSLRSEQILFPSVEEQIEHRNRVIESPREYLPPQPYRDKIKKELLEVEFGKKKQAKIRNAIRSIGSSWLAEHLFGGD